MMPSSKKQSWLVLPVRQFAQTCVEIKFDATCFRSCVDGVAIPRIDATLSLWSRRLDGVYNLIHWLISTQGQTSKAKLRQT